MQPGQVWNSRSPDSAVRAVAVEGLNRRRTTCVILANLVCEEVDGRYHWREYRFRMSAVARYSFGPHDRAHGFERNVFMDQRKFMGRPVMHVWSLALSDAAPTTLISLFAEAMELPPKVLGEA
jgi:hypothetical protein